MSPQTFFGWLLMIVGALVVVLSGGCSFIFIINTSPHGDILDLLKVVSLFGGIPCLAGIILFFAGKALRPNLKDKSDQL